MRFRRETVALLALLGVVRAGDNPLGEDPYAADVELRVATAEQVAERFDVWLKRPPPEVDAAAVRARWATGAAREPLARLAEALAAGHPAAAAAMAAAGEGRAPDEESARWLTAQSGLLGDTLRLAVGRALAQQGRYAAAEPWLAAVAPAESIDPAQALFYLATCQHARLSSDDCLDTLARLLEVEPLPARYRVVARAMQAEMRGLESETLDYVSRQMRDVERRLAQGDADRPLRSLQDDVLAALDKLIQEEEDKQNQSGAGGGAGSSAQGGAMQPAQPAQDSRLLGGRGPGRVAPKALGSGSGWGSLPPKEREEAWQQLGREFPSHYRDVVEQYFRELAREEQGTPQP